MRQQVYSADAPEPAGPYSQAIVSNGLVFCSATLGIDPATGKVAESIMAQADQALRNLSHILSQSGSSMHQLLKTTIYYVGAEDFAVINEVYERHMPDPPPARSAVPCVALPLGAQFCVDAIARLI
jgi:2-iminobutanoate/2-iminopropanoate deaminase